MTQRRKHKRAMTLIEILVAVAIVAILAAIAVVNFLHAQERALKSADASNLHVIATALEAYYIDYDALPPADQEAGPFMSQTSSAIQNGPAGGGSWDGLPWLLYEYKYIGDWKILFCPKYLKLYSGPSTIRGGWPRYHNFRYAYNSASAASGGAWGGTGNLMSGTVWIVRDLWLGPRDGWWADAYPNYPADFTFPWGEGEWAGKLEQAIFSDMAVKTVVGGKN